MVVFPKASTTVCGNRLRSRDRRLVNASPTERVVGPIGRRLRRNRREARGACRAREGAVGGKSPVTRAVVIVSWHDRLWRARFKAQEEPAHERRARQEREDHPGHEALDPAASRRHRRHPATHGAARGEGGRGQPRDPRRSRQRVRRLHRRLADRRGRRDGAAAAGRGGTQADPLPGRRNAGDVLRASRGGGRLRRLLHALRLRGRRCPGRLRGSRRQPEGHGRDWTTWSPRITASG